MEEKKLIEDYISKEVTTIPNQLNEKLYYKNNKFNERKELEKIKFHIDEFIDDNPSDRFIVLSGLQGVGKSTLLFQIYEYLLRQKKYSAKSDIIFILQIFKLLK